MRMLAAVATLIALFPLDATCATAAGGKACQVAASAVPTPGLEELVMGSKSDPVPNAARLTERQIEKLADIDTMLRRRLGEVEAAVAKLPDGVGGAVAASAPATSARELPELVAAFLADAVRDRAILIDVEAAPEFRLANSEAIEARQQGDSSRWCSLCFAVRAGMEATFGWRPTEFGSLTEAQANQVRELASQRESLRRSWVAALEAELTQPQLTWIRMAQMRWLQSTLTDSVRTGMRSLGTKACDACDERPAIKCHFCALVLIAVEDAKRAL